MRSRIQSKIFIPLVILINLTIGGLTTQYTLQFWTSYFGEPIVLPFWAAALAGLFAAPVTVPLAVATFVIRWFV